MRSPRLRVTLSVTVLGALLLAAGAVDAARTPRPPVSPPEVAVAVAPPVAQLRTLLRGPTVPVAPPPPPEQVSAVVGDEPLTMTFERTVRSLDGVAATTRTVAAMRGLFGSVTADGTPRDVVPPGMRIPVSVTAIDPATYLDVLVGPVPPDDAALVRTLGAGEVLLSTRSAALRGLDVGARVDLGDADGLVVAGVVSDAVARGGEFLVTLEDRDTVGFTFGGREALLVRHAGTAPVRAALDTSAEAAEATEGDGDTLRVWHGGRRVPLVLDTLTLKERFGEFAFRLVLDQREIDVDPAYVEANIVKERMPVIGTVRCHRAIMDDLRAAVDELIAAGHEDWLSPRRYAGCFYPRRIGFGRENLSRHTWGIAIDLNVDFSLPGAGPVAPDDLVAIMGRHGFRWGGDFSTPDNHHFEWVGEAATVRPDRAPDPDGGDTTDA